jgi:molybdate transport system substrate-binding protein
MATARSFTARPGSRRRWLAPGAVLALAALAATTALVPLAAAQGRPVLVFAAASLKNALDDVVAQYERETGKKVSVSYGASSALAKQIEAAAPADLFMSADLDWMDYLDQRKLIKPATRVQLLGNELVLIGPKTGTANMQIGPGFPLVELLGPSGRLAIADPKAVPAGKYGRAALESLGAWSSVENRLAPTENVRLALALVSRGETPLGIVYKTDAAADPNVRIVGTFPANTHPPIVYPAALTESASADAPAFLAYLRSAASRPLWEKQGFTALK